MVFKKYVKTIALASFLTFGIGYKLGDNYLDKNLNSIIEERWYAPEWATLFPWKSDRILDIYLEKMKDYHKTAHPQMNLEGFSRAIIFAEDKVPERIGEVYTEIVEYLLMKGEIKDASDYARWSDDYKLMKKVKCYSE